MHSAGFVSEIIETNLIDALAVISIIALDTIVRFIVNTCR